MKNNSRFDFVQLRSAIASGSVELPQAVFEAMENPIDFPSIDRAIVPGDRIAIAVHSSLIQAQAVVVAVIDWLWKQENLSDIQITVVLASGSDSLATSIRDWLANEQEQRISGLPTQCRVVCHDPDDPQNLEYIAASAQAEAIYLHRDLVEADFVIPIYRWLEPNDPRRNDPYVVLPAFADRATINRHAKAWLRQAGAPIKSSKNLPESGWLVGVQFAIGILANQEGHIARLVSGTPEAVDRACREGLVSSATPNSGEIEKGFELIVVQLVDESSGSLWSQVASAAHSAQRWLTPTGRIVVVATSLDDVSAGISALASDEPDEELQQILLEGQLEDAFSAAVLRGIQSRRSVYLQSQVDPEILESLGFASIRDPSELERLMQSVPRVGVMEY
jgi:hypothetical protein